MAYKLFAVYSTELTLQTSEHKMDLFKFAFV